MGENKAQGLPKREIIKRKNVLERLLKKGIVVKGELCRIYFMPGPERKAAFLVAKRTGNAVRRNRIKRWLRELYRRKREMAGEKFYLAFLVSRDNDGLSYHGLEKDFDAMLPSVRNILASMESEG